MKSNYSNFSASDPTLTNQLQSQRNQWESFLIPLDVLGRILLDATASGRLDVQASLVGILLGALIPINSQVHVRYHLFDLPGRERIARFRTLRHFLPRSCEHVRNFLGIRFEVNIIFILSLFCSYCSTFFHSMSSISNKKNKLFVAAARIEH